MLTVNPHDITGIRLHCKTEKCFGTIEVPLVAAKSYLENLAGKPSKQLLCPFCDAPIAVAALKNVIALSEAKGFELVVRHKGA